MLVELVKIPRRLSVTIRNGVFTTSAITLVVENFHLVDTSGRSIPFYMAWGEILLPINDNAGGLFTGKVNAQLRKIFPKLPYYKYPNFSRLDIITIHAPVDGDFTLQWAEINMTMEIEAGRRELWWSHDNSSWQIPPDSTIVATAIKN